MNPRVIMPNHLQITLEDHIIRHIEPRNGRIQPDIRLCDVLSEQIGLMAGLAQMGFYLVQCFEERVDVRIIRFLGRCEARLVDPVVDSVIDPFVHGVDLLSQMFGIEAPTRTISFSKLRWKELVEFGIEHPNDLAAFVVHNRLFLLIPQCWHGVSARVIWVSFEVEVFQVLEPVYRVFLVRALATGEKPPVGTEFKVENGDLDDGFEALEGPDEVGAMRPWTAPVDVENVAVFLWREFGGGGARDP